MVCAQAIMTPENCVAETERLIAAALYHRRPVYMAFPTDYATRPAIGKACHDCARQRSSGFASRGECDRQRPFGEQDRLHPVRHHHRALRTAQGGDRSSQHFGPAFATMLIDNDPR